VFWRCRLPVEALFLLGRGVDCGANLLFATFDVGFPSAAFLDLVKLLSHFNS
jgi:hypothetical protein